VLAGGWFILAIFYYKSKKAQEVRSTIAKKFDLNALNSEIQDQGLEWRVLDLGEAEILELDLKFKNIKDGHVRPTTISYQMTDGFFQRPGDEISKQTELRISKDELIAIMEDLEKEFG